MVNFTNYQKKDYFNLRDEAWRILINNNVCSMPVDIIKILKEYCYIVLPYNKSKEILANLDIENRHLKYKAITIYLENEPIVFYNSEIDERIYRFSLAHELGHIIMKHLKTKYSKEREEKEANMFAARVLAPLCVLNELKIKDFYELSNLCNISIKSANIRFIRLNKKIIDNKFYTNELEIKLLNNFKDFIKYTGVNK